MKFKKIITLVVTVCLVSILLAIPAFATVTESDGDGYALYNGVKLPNIDSVVEVDNGDNFAYIYEYDLSELDVNGHLFELAGYKSGVMTHFVCATSTDIIDGMVSMGFEAPTLNTWTEYVELTSYLDYSYIWVSEYPSSVTDSPYYGLYSEPIPLDGYNVIEWDGDTTGLTSYKFNETSYYELTDYSNASSALCLYKNPFGVEYSSNYVASGGNWYCHVSNIPYCISSYDRNSISSIYFSATGDYSASYCPLIAYVPGIEPPPGEGGGESGGGDDPDDPQPPCGVARYDYYR